LVHCTFHMAVELTHTLALPLSKPVSNR
jgi:hypothetical protein